MNLKDMLMKENGVSLTAREYRIGSQYRIRAGQALALFTPLVAIGAVSNSPLLMIPALYVPAAIALPELAAKTQKTMTAAGVPFVVAIWVILAFVAHLLSIPLGRLAGAKHFWRDAITLAAFFLGVEMYHKLVVHYSWYMQHHGMIGHELRFEAHYGWTLVVIGLAMTGVCAWLSYTFMKGRRTQSMQRIAAHLAQQEA
ncbi:hypothetical protein HF289_13270 [Acidithiobacillus ferrooxidans]|uniref:hypothetical protein n=1 Tax=Acidithiobacillus ferrooxidans TaxID=920 RepID=UPI001C07A26E|nr:hypothetical protein [Acidithiobacillus ferrooxidans]MBU2857800.1 hypothetical protein [Acidithiobacillus ferrooxidans]